MPARVGQSRGRREATVRSRPSPTTGTGCSATRENGSARGHWEGSLAGAKMNGVGSMIAAWRRRLLQSGAAALAVTCGVWRVWRAQQCFDSQRSCSASNNVMPAAPAFALQSRNAAATRVCLAFLVSYWTLARGGGRFVSSARYRHRRTSPRHQGLPLVLAARPETSSTASEAAQPLPAVPLHKRLKTGRRGGPLEPQESRNDTPSTRSQETRRDRPPWASTTATPRTSPSP